MIIKNNKQAVTEITARRPFTNGRSFRGVWTNRGVETPGRLVYVVYSGDTPIAYGKGKHLEVKSGPLPRTQETHRALLAGL